MSYDSNQHKDDNLLQGLNEHQFEAVTMPDESAIILAGAGSGKTRVLTSRIAWLMREGRSNAKEILAVTFTNKAAKEMKNRLSSLCSAPVGNMWIGTFHGLCNRMLRENSKLAGLPSGFSIMDEDDQASMVKRLLKEDTSAPEDMKPKDLQTFINKSKEKGIRASRAQPNSLFEDYAVPFYARYEALCARQGTIDFAELQLRTCELMQSNQEFLDRYQNRYSHILVDEFQDTNLMQYEWLKTLRGDRATIFAVGDDDQSIYGFRGSNPQNMTDFVSEIANGKIVRLEQNYRSSGNILAAANALIDKNASRLGKNLWTDANHGPRMKVMNFARDIDEAEHVGMEIKGWINEGVDPSQVAILYRSNNQSRAYEKALMSRGVPYVIYGGTRFFERMEIKNALAYLKLTLNLNDDVSFRRVVNFPPRGLGDVTVDRIADIANSNSDGNGPISLMEAAATRYEGKSKDKIDNFVTLIVDLLDSAQQMPLTDFIEHTLKLSGLKDVYEKNKEEEERSQNLGELLTAARNFCEESQLANASSVAAVEILSEFLGSASLESALDKSNEENEAKERVAVKAVTLMTVHSAKGLEFDNVVVGGVEEGLFPNQKSLDEGSDEEERRLMYVAITRARKQIVATCAKYRFVYGEKKELEPSRFLTEIPVELKDQHRISSPFWNQAAEKKPAYGANKWTKKGTSKTALATTNPFSSTAAERDQANRAAAAASVAALVNVMPDAAFQSVQDPISADIKIGKNSADHSVLLNTHESESETFVNVETVSENDYSQRKSDSPPPKPVSAQRMVFRRR